MIITCATKEEMNALVPKEYHKKVVITGVGMINTLEVLSDLMKSSRNRNKQVINIGYVGSNNLPVGTICVPYQVKMYQTTSHDLVPTGEKMLNFLSNVKSLTCYTAHDFVTECPFEQDCIFDMELAAYTIVPHVYSIKVVSDNLNIDKYYKEALHENYQDEIRKLIHKIEGVD